LSNSEPSISQEISTATGNSTSIRTSAAYTPPGPSFQSSHTQMYFRFAAWGDVKELGAVHPAVGADRRRSLQTHLLT